MLNFQHDDSRVRTPAEIAAGVTPVNYAYDPGEWDRYGENTTPGTTDMTAAANAATQVAKRSGCKVIWGRTAPYRLDSPVNVTECRGIVFNDVSSKNASAGVPSIIIAHTGHGFDLSASSELTFNDVAASNLSGTVPKSLFFCARNAAGSGAGTHRFYNIRTPSACTFTCIYYGYGSEENVFDSCSIYNAQPSSALFSHNQDNPSSFSSTFVTIATGAQSNACHRHVNGQYFNVGNSGSTNELIFALQAASNFTYRDGLWYCGNGLAYVHVSDSSAGLTIDSIRGEPDSAHPTYGITCVTAASTHVNWTLNNVHADCGQHVLHFADTTQMVNLATRVVTAQSGKLLNVYSLSNSVIEHATSIVEGRSGGTVANNTFVGSRSAITLSGTDSLNTGFDQALGEYWSTGDRYTAASTACTGALTVASTYKIVKTGQQITLTILTTTGTATAAASFAYGVAIPALYRPAEDMSFPCWIQDNGARLNQPGRVQITSSTGVITVFKDGVGTANWTAAAGAGLLAISVGWRL